ncbi:MAG TPA: DEAD/DEAH box helicase, partial [Saprospiraceae bacterium]|nr:DEAD/DEAH box helicase [Saprospiraceae bacterium]
MSQPVDILRKYWGYALFRPLQQQIIDAVLEKKDVLALLPTGGGKSLCYQVPAMMLDGVTIVVSPLIALMKDQVTRL